MRHPLFLLTAVTGKTPHTDYLRMLTRVDFVLALSAPSRVDCFDALLLLGGDDPDPALYRQTVFNDTVQIDAPRDRLELTLIQMFASVGKPIFGICRGIQILNVALGGSLWQDLPAQRGYNHSGGRQHEIVHTDGLFTHTLWGDRCEVNSFHHQAIDRLAPGLVAASRASDGVIEAVQHEKLPFYAVQWHPERQPAMEGFFDWMTRIWI